MCMYYFNIVLCSSCVCVYVMYIIGSKSIGWLNESTTFITHFFFFISLSSLKVNHVHFCLSVCLFSSFAAFAFAPPINFFFISNIFVVVVEIHLNLNVYPMHILLYFFSSLQCSNLFNEINTIEFSDL